MRAEGEGGNSGLDCWMASQLDEYELEQTPGDSEGQGSLACCSPQGYKEPDMTKQQILESCSVTDHCPHLHAMNYDCEF